MTDSWEKSYRGNAKTMSQDLLGMKAFVIFQTRCREIPPFLQTNQGKSQPKFNGHFRHLTRISFPWRSNSWKVWNRENYFIAYNEKNKKVKDTILSHVAETQTVWSVSLGKNSVNRGNSKKKAFFFLSVEKGKETTLEKKESKSA